MRKVQGFKPIKKKEEIKVKNMVKYRMQKNFLFSFWEKPKTLNPKKARMKIVNVLKANKKMICITFKINISLIKNSIIYRDLQD